MDCPKSLPHTESDMVFDHVGKAIPVQEADPTLTFEESNYSYSNNASPAPALAMAKQRTARVSSFSFSNILLSLRHGVTP